MGTKLLYPCWDLIFDATIYFAANEAFKRNVLGRRGFLDRVLLGLNDYEGKMYLSCSGSEG